MCGRTSIVLFGLYSMNDTLIEPNADAFGAMQPRPLMPRWMPALESEMGKDNDDDDISFVDTEQSEEAQRRFRCG